MYSYLLYRDHRVCNGQCTVERFLISFLLIFRTLYNHSVALWLFVYLLSRIYSYGEYVEWMVE